MVEQMVGSQIVHFAYQEQEEEELKCVKSFFVYSDLNQYTSLPTTHFTQKCRRTQTQRGGRKRNELKNWLPLFKHIYRKTLILECWDVQMASWGLSRMWLKLSLYTEIASCIFFKLLSRHIISPGLEIPIPIEILSYCSIKKLELKILYWETGRYTQSRQKTIHTHIEKSPQK